MPDFRTYSQKARDAIRLLSQHAGSDLSGENDIAAFKKQFAKLAIRLHPDKSGADTKDAFAAVSAAWEELQEAVRCGVRLPLPPETPPVRPAPQPQPSPQHRTNDPRAPRRGPRVYRTVITPGGTFEAEIPPPPPPWWQDDLHDMPQHDAGEWEAAAGPVRIDFGPEESLLDEFARRMANTHNQVRVTPVPVERAHATALPAKFVLAADQTVDATVIGQPKYTKLRGTLEQPNSILRGTFRVRFVSRIEAIVDGIRCQVHPPLRVS